MYTRKTVSTVLLMALFASSLFTQTGGTFDMSTNAVTSGGERSVSGNILLESTLGQPVVGSRSNAGTVEFYGGFWSIFASAAGGAVTISPSAASVPSGSPQAFTATGGLAPYTYSLVQNISGAMINPTSGVYTAGPNGGIDIVRVTDGEGNFDEATVTVTATDVACPGGQKLWDGGGLTNNWSDAANWCGNVLPDSGSVIVFNGTSSKNAIVDINADVNSFNLNAGFSGTVAIAPGITVGTAVGSTFNAGTFDVGGGTLNLASTFNTLNGGTFNAGTGTVNINFFLNVAGGTFNGGSATLSIPVVNVTAGSFISTTATLSVSQNIQLTGGSVDLDNGTIVFTGTGNGSVSGTNGPFNNITVNKADNVGVSFAGTNIVNGSLNLTDGLINTGTLEARGPVNFGASFGQLTGAGDGVIALRGAAASRIVNLPSGVSLPDIIVDDANTTVSANGPGMIRTDSITLTMGSIDFGSSDMTFGYNAGGSGSHYLQTGGSFSISTGNIVWNSFGNFTLSNGAFNAGSGTVHLGGNIFTLSGGTFTPSTGSNTFNFDFNNAFGQSGGVFGTGAGSIDINGRFTLSGGTFNASAGNTNYGFVFDHTAGTFNNNAGTVIFDSPHPAYTLNVPGNPGTGVFNNLTMNPTTDNANIALGSDIFEVNGNLQILNGQMTVGRFAAKGDVTIEAAADGGNAEMNFGGPANQRFTNNGGLNTTGTWTVDKTGGAVIAGTDLQLETTQPLNINSGTLYLEDSSDLTAGAITIGVGGRLVNDSSTVIALGGTLTNDGRVELAGGGVSCPQTDTVVIRSTSDGVPRAWNGTGVFRISDANIKDMAGAAAITAFSSTDEGGNGANWTFDAGCPADLAISPQYTSSGTSQSQVFAASGGVGTRTFSLFQNNSGGSIDPVSGLYTSGSVSGVTDVVRVTDGNNDTADAFISVVGCVNPPEELRAWYRAEGTANDETGAFPGTLLNGTSTSGGYKGRAFTFDGVDDIVTIGNASNLNFSFTDFSIEGWVRPLENGGYIFSWEQSGRYIRLVSEGTNVGFEVFSGSGIPVGITAPAVLSFGDWYHVAAVRRGSLFELYVNGSIAAADNNATVTSLGSGSSMSIGGRQASGGSTDPFFFFGGQIDELSIYQKALTEAEIRNIVDARTSGKCGAPTALTLLPATATADSGETVQFEGVGGAAPYFYSISTNNSDGSINPSTGLYTAGPNSGVDTIRVTDGSNDTAESTVTVTALNPPTCITATIPTGLAAQNGDVLSVPVQVSDTTGNGITAFDFNVSFDPAVLTPAATPFSNSGTMSSTYEIVANPNTPGTLRIVGFGVQPLTGSGALVNLQFDVIGDPGDSSALNLTAFEFNEGTPCASVSNGSVSVIGGSISGKVTYGNAAVETPVSDTTLTLSGATTGSEITDSNGLYFLPGVNVGSNTVTPSKSGDVNGISGFDASQVARFVAGLLPLSANQQIASDTSDNGTISAFDASIIAQYVAALTPPGVTGTWKFVPASRNYVDIAVDQLNEDYEAILMGEVSGNWSIVPPLGIVAPEDAIKISIKPVLAHRNSTVVIPIRTERMTGRGIFAFQFDVVFDPLVITPAQSAVEKTGTLSRQMTVVENTVSPGVLRVVVFGTSTLSGLGNLINLKFDAIGGLGSTTEIAFSNFQFNEGLPVSTVTTGKLEVIAPSSSHVSLAGRAITQEGIGIKNAMITIADPLGNRSFAMTNQFGYYYFNDIPIGQTYVLSIKSKGFVFDPSTRTVDLSGPLATVDFIGAGRVGPY